MKQAFCGKRRLYLAAVVTNSSTGNEGYVEHTDLDALSLGHGKIHVYTKRGERGPKHLFDEKVCRAEFFKVASVYRNRFGDEEIY